MASQDLLGEEFASLIATPDFPEWPSLAMAEQQQLLIQQHHVIQTPTMHPKLVATIRSILSPPKEMRKALFPPHPSSKDPPADEEEEEQQQAHVVSLDLIRNRRPFTCGFEGCHKTFKNPQTMKMHHKTHYAAAGGAVTGKLLLMESSLSSSPFASTSKAGHNKKIPSRCPLCRKTFVGLYELRRHFGRKHSEGEKMHVCRKCGKRFYIEVDLRDHEKICGELIRCKCGMKFAFKCNLVAHKRAHRECQEHVQDEEEEHDHRKSTCQQSSSKRILRLTQFASPTMQSAPWQAITQSLDVSLTMASANAETDVVDASPKAFCL